MNKSLQERKHAQKEANLLRILSKLLSRICYDEKELNDVTLHRVKLSPDKGSCSVFFYTPGGIEQFEKKLPKLILYKPSIRKALSQELASRYVPELFFKYDALFEKQKRVDDLFSEISSELESSIAHEDDTE